MPTFPAQFLRASLGRRRTCNKQLRAISPRAPLLLPATTSPISRQTGYPPPPMRAKFHSPKQIEEPVYGLNIERRAQLQLLRRAAQFPLDLHLVSAPSLEQIFLPTPSRIPGRTLRNLL